MASTVKRRNPNALTATRRNALEFGKYRVKVGWSVELGASEETVTIAAINVLGAPAANIPPRDPLTPVLTEQAARIRKASRDAAHAANTGGDVRYPLELLAGDLEYQLKQSVEQLSTPPNADSTVESKGFQDPLVGAGADGGRLVAEAAAAVTER